MPDLYGMLKNHTEYEGDTSSVKFIAISRQVSIDSQLSVSAGIFQTALVHESGIIRGQMGKKGKS
jgi:hypothetical protein